MSRASRHSRTQYNRIFTLISNECGFIDAAFIDITSLVLKLNDKWMHDIEVKKAEILSYFSNLKYPFCFLSSKYDANREEKQLVYFEVKRLLDESALRNLLQLKGFCLAPMFLVNQDRSARSEIGSRPLFYSLRRRF